MTAADLDRDALLLAIVTGPADDAPRLAMADWLEENGQPERAEFVRVQVRLAGVPQYVPRGNGVETLNGEWLELSRREAGLWAGYTFAPPMPDGFAGTLGGTRPPAARTAAVRRGFVAAVSCPLADWLTHGPRLVRGHPITDVWASDREPFGWLGGAWGWCRGSPGLAAPGTTHVVPPAVWNVIRQPPHVPGGWWKNFPTPDAAHAALSLALVAWARREAGLPPLPG